MTLAAPSHWALPTYSFFGMPVMRPSPRLAKPARLKDQKAEAAAVNRSGQRLGTNARRDIRWALQQTPGDNVRDVTLHGVRISFNTTNPQGCKEAVPPRRGEPTQHKDSSKPDSADKPPNSRQRRSQARAKKYYEQLKAKGADAMAQDEPASARPPGPEPVA